PEYAYLDTNAFRYFGTAFESAPLADELRDKILIPRSARLRFSRNWRNPKVRVCCRGRVSGCTKFGFKSRVRMTDSPKRYHLGGVGLVTSCLTTMHSGQPSSETATKCGEVQVAEFSRGSGSLLGRCAT